MEKEITLWIRPQRRQIAIYQIGDKVAHPGHGGCIIQAISERKIAGETRNYFVLIPKSEPNTTILTPVESVEKNGLRKIISEEAADEILTSFSDTGNVEWVTDHSKRKQAYEDTLKTGDLDLIAQMIKELIVRGTESPLNHNDKELLPKAQKRLFSEIALAKGLDFDQVLDLVTCAACHS